MLEYSLIHILWRYRTTESRGLLEWILGLSSTLLLPTVRRQRSCVRVPAEGDKGVTGSSEVSLVISQWQPCLPWGRFNQTLAEPTSDPEGLSRQVPSADSGSASKDLHNVWGDKSCSFYHWGWHHTLKVQGSFCPSLWNLFSADLALVLDHVTTSIDWKQGGLFRDTR